VYNISLPKITVCPYPIPIALGTVPVAFSTTDTVPYPQTLRTNYSDQ